MMLSCFAQAGFSRPEWKRFTALSAFVCVALVAGACDTVPLLAPTGSTVTVSAPTRVLPVGGTTEIQAFVIETSGTPVQNGTSVRFTTTLGIVSPAEAQTRNGLATTIFTGTSSGNAEIRAVSGASGGGAGNGTGTPTGTNVVTIAVGTAAVTTGGVSVRASPSSVASTGGTVEIIASVVGEGGRALPGVLVAFSSSRGSLSASSAITNEIGDARTTLTTSEMTTVTARAGTISGTVDVTARTGPSVTLTCAVGATANCASLTVGQLATFTASRGTTTSTITSARLEFGDGESVSLGNLSSPATVTHAYASSGTFTARLVATDINGEATSAVQIVQVRGVVGVSVTVSQSGTRQVTATATLSGVSVSDSDVVTYEWTFTDGTTPGTVPNVVTTTSQATFTFSTTGPKSVSVRVTLRDGRTATGSTTFTVT